MEAREKEKILPLIATSEQTQRLLAKVLSNGLNVSSLAWGSQSICIPLNLPKKKPYGKKKRCKVIAIFRYAFSLSILPIGAIDSYPIQPLSQYNCITFFSQIASFYIVLCDRSLHRLWFVPRILDSLQSILIPKPRNLSVEPSYNLNYQISWHGNRRSDRGFHPNTLYCLLT